MLECGNWAAGTWPTPEFERTFANALITGDVQYVGTFDGSGGWATPQRGFAYTA